MSEEQFNAFLQAINTDPSLQERLKSAVDVDAISKIADELGFQLSADELLKTQLLWPEDDLEQISGGRDKVHSREPGPSTTQFIFSNSCTN